MPINGRPALRASGVSVVNFIFLLSISTIRFFPPLHFRGCAANAFVANSPGGGGSQVRAGGWSGAQYSTFRVLLGSLVLLRLVYSAAAYALPAKGSVFWLVAWVPSLFSRPVSDGTVSAFLAVGALVAVPFILGWKDRLLAPLLAWLLFSLHQYSPEAGGGSPAALGLLMLLHALLPSAPYGSWDAIGRVDPGGHWQFRPLLYRVAWGLFLVVWANGIVGRIINAMDATTYYGLAKFAALGLFGLLGAIEFVAIIFLYRNGSRRKGWLVLVACWFVWLIFLGLSHANEGLLLLLLFQFDPGWVRPVALGKKEYVFYDGDCGLCHRAVRFLLAEDRAGTLLFAPLQGTTVAERIPEDRRARLPDSIVFQRADGRVSIHSQAVFAILLRLGGLHRVLGIALGAMPKGPADAAYKAVARSRKKMFEKPAEACPIVPKHLKAKFLA